MMKRAMLMIFSSTLLLNAETIITMDLVGKTLESTGNPYVVNQDILIPEGKSIIIKEGCVFLFKPFTGINVQGELLVEGSQEKPVTFTSIYDGEFNKQSTQLPNPFDWNGILISRESGNVSLSNFSLRFSVYGIKSQNPNIKIENGLFRQNGQIHITIAEKIHFVQDNIPYSYVTEKSIATDTTVKKPAEISGSKPVLIKETNESKNRKKVKILRFASLGIGTAGLITGVIFGAQLPSAHDDWVESSNDEQYFQQYSEREKKYKNKLTGTIIGSSLAVLGAAGFGISFAF